MAICPESGRPPCWSAGVGVGAGFAVLVGGGVESVEGVEVRERGLVEVVVVEVDVVEEEWEVVVEGDVEVLVEERVDVDSEGEVGVSVEEVDVLGLSSTQNGDSVSAPIHVCVSAQQMDPHWKSPVAQALVHPAGPASGGQQKKASSVKIHVSPAPPAGVESR